jgi:hypothetical protein
MLSNTSFYQASATAFIALLGAGILAESRESPPVAPTRPEGAPATSAPSAGPDAVPQRWALSIKVIRESGLTLLLGISFALGEILCLIVLAENHALGWQFGLVSYSLIIGVIVTISLAFGAVVQWRVPELGERPRRRMQVVVLLVLATAASVFLITSIVTKRRGFGSFSLPLPAGYYLVHGTCADGICDLSEHISPSRTSRTTSTVWSDDDAVHVSCQVAGARFTDHHNSTSVIWDKLADSHYVTDVFVKTPGRGTFSPGIRRCSSPSRGASG